MKKIIGQIIEGDFVKVVKNGQTFSTYSDMFIELGFIDVKHNREFENGTIAKVFGKKYIRERRKLYMHWLIVMEMNA